MIEAQQQRCLNESHTPTLKRQWDAGSVRRFAAMSSDATSGAAFDLSNWWAAAAAGHVRVVDAFFGAERCFAIQCQGAGRRLPPRRREILERVLLGARPKVVALELSLSPSSVSGAVTQCLKTLGLAQSQSLPVVLMMALRAARCGYSFDARLSRLLLDGQEFDVLSVARPDLVLDPCLSPAERAIMTSVVEGESHISISRQRGTSPRTIANQLGAAYRKLGVSGRLEVIDRLVRSRSVPPPLS